MSLASRRREKDIEREERRVQRVQREAVAGKLLQRFPEVTSLDITVHEARPEGCVSDSHYIRRIVLEHAPALFEVPCSYPSCEDGGYDITHDVIAALTARDPKVEGEKACRGRCGSLDCTRVLRFVVKIGYRDRAARPSTAASS
jgi:hypothetical protein